MERKKQVKFKPIIKWPILKSTEIREDTCLSKFSTHKINPRWGPKKSTSNSPNVPRVDTYIDEIGRASAKLLLSLLTKEMSNFFKVKLVFLFCFFIKLKKWISKGEGRHLPLFQLIPVSPLFAELDQDTKKKKNEALDLSQIANL